jgi:hypothetical protein
MLITSSIDQQDFKILLMFSKSFREEFPSGRWQDTTRARHSSDRCGKTKLPDTLRASLTAACRPEAPSERLLDDQ